MKEANNVYYAYWYISRIVFICFESKEKVLRASSVIDLVILQRLWFFVPKQSISKSSGYSNEWFWAEGSNMPPKDNQNVLSYYVCLGNQITDWLLTAFGDWRIHVLKYEKPSDCNFRVFTLGKRLKGSAHCCCTIAPISVAYICGGRIGLHCKVSNSLAIYKGAKLWVTKAMKCSACGGRKTDNFRCRVHCLRKRSNERKSFMCESGSCIYKKKTTTWKTAAAVQSRCSDNDWHCSDRQK